MKEATRAKSNSPPLQRKAGEAGLALHRKQQDTAAPVQRDATDDELKKLGEAE